MNNQGKSKASSSTQRASKSYMRHIEEEASKLRRRAGIGPEDRLDPWVLLEQFDLMILYAHEVEGLTVEALEYIASTDAKKWSGTGVPLPDDSLLVVLHPKQTPERANVTIMEEVAHVHYDHEPSLISRLSGLEKRHYEKDVEQEAYWTAGAALLPSKVVAQAIWRRQSIPELAAAYGASIELAEMRISTLGLWDEYQRYPPELRKAS